MRSQNFRLKIRISKNLAREKRKLCAGKVESPLHYQFKRKEDFRASEAGNKLSFEALQDSLRIRAQWSRKNDESQRTSGLLLWVYFMGISTAWPKSGKPGWPTDGDVACGPSGGPVAVDREG